MIDYTRFVRERRPLWERFAGGLRRLEVRRARRGKTPPTYGEVEQLAFAYRQVLHDFALASHRFGGTAVARQLGTLALAGTQRLTRRSAGRRGLVHFFRATFPAAFRRLLPLLALAIAIFAASAVWGLALAAAQPALAERMLGAKGMQDLAAGHLWTESLATTVPFGIASSAIVTNNLKVALVAWGGGTLAGAGSLFVLVINGLSFGGLLGITLRFSMGTELLTFVVAHGLLEITLILVCAAAGLAIGRAMVGAGDRPRSEALREAGLDSLCVVLGCLPWFVVLALIEGRLSPDPSVPVAGKVLLGLALELVFLGVALAPPRAPASARGGDRG